MTPLKARLGALSAVFFVLTGAQAQTLTRERLDALFDGARTRAARASFKPKEGLEAWLVSERKVALAKMLANVSPDGAAPGTVAASPSHKDPDYWYNWKRDAALTMSEVVSLYRASSGAERERYLGMLRDYASYARREQGEPGQAGLGEPKSNMDGSVFTGPWGRPQDDGPAEEASTLISLARELIAQGKTGEARALYGDFTTGIKGDLEYVSHRWRETSFDAWEEVKARHFDTEMAQRRALLEGAALSDQLGDPGAAKWYREQAQGLEADLERHWDGARGYIVCALDRDGGLDYKTSGLDSAVILAVIHRGKDDGDFFGPTDPRVLATAGALVDAFKSGYPINAEPGAPGVGIGRYPEDRYYGGNPWVLSTDAFAELYYDAAAAFVAAGKIDVDARDLGFFRGVVGERKGLEAGETISSSQPLFSEVVTGLKSRGDSFLEVVRAHAYPDGSLSEQIDKKSGAMTSARDLTWNYASLLTALQARDSLSRLDARR